MAITDIMAGLRDMLYIDELMKNLARVRRLFHSEADFQHALAWQIHEALPQGQVRLEVDVARAAGRRMYLDIWLPEERIAIELKYLTRRLDLTHRGERFALRDHAQDLGRYEFLKEVRRLEMMRSMPEVCRAGYAVLLTNDHLYWTAPGRRVTVDAAFRIHEGREISGELAWSERAGRGTVKDRESPIELENSYSLRWREYSDLPGVPAGRFRYLAVSVH